MIHFWASWYSEKIAERRCGKGGPGSGGGVGGGRLWFHAGCCAGCFWKLSISLKVHFTEALRSITVLITYSWKPTIPEVKGLTRLEGKNREAWPRDVAWAQGRWAFRPPRLPHGLRSQTKSSLRAGKTNCLLMAPVKYDSEECLWQSRG